MPAPTALLRSRNSEAGEEQSDYNKTQAGDDAAPEFYLNMSAPLLADPKEIVMSTEHTHSNEPYRIETRKIPIPPHRYSPFKSSWNQIYPPLVEHLQLQVRMNVKNRTVELRTSRHTTDLGALQKGEDFVKAIALGFDTADAIALLRLDDLYLETFEIKDIKTLQGEHLSRAIGRIAGKDGKTRFAIENTSKTRIVLAGQKIHILGAFANIKIAREAVVSLVLGSPPSKVYGNLRKVASKMKARF